MASAGLAGLAAWATTPVAKAATASQRAGASDMIFSDSVKRTRRRASFAMSPMQRKCPSLQSQREELNENDAGRVFRLVGHDAGKIGRDIGDALGNGIKR